jgi:hypothetical protein
MVSPFLGLQYPRGDGRLEGQDPKVLRRRLSRQRGEEERRSLELRTSEIVFSLLGSTLQGVEDVCDTREAGRRYPRMSVSSRLRESVGAYFAVQTFTGLKTVVVNLG